MRDLTTGDANRISIAMCTCNGEAYLAEQLNSIAEQTRLPDELIVCDDASTDNTIGILEQFSKNSAFPVRVYLNKQRLGSTKNFEKVISLCNGEFIFLSDQDDVWMPQKIECILQVFMNNSDAGYVFSDALIVDDEARPMGYTMWESIRFTKRQRKRFKQGKQLAILLKHNVVTGATMAFRAKLKSIVIPISEVWIHDEWIALLASSINMHGVFIEQPLIRYRQHSSQQIGGRRKEHSFIKQVRCALATKDQSFINDFYQVELKFSKALERLNLMLQLDDNNNLRYIEAKINYLRARQNHYITRQYIRKHKNHIARLTGILKELLTFRYHRFSNGWKTVLRDLFL